MNKKDLIEKLAGYKDDAKIIISFDAGEISPEIDGLEHVSFDVKSVSDEWKSVDVATLEMDNLIMV